MNLPIVVRVDLLTRKALEAMAELGVKEAAAISRIATLLAGFVTNSIIENVARHLRVAGLTGSNKVDKLFDLLTALMSDRRAARKAADAVVLLTMEAHHRAVKGANEMKWEDADAIVVEMRALGLDPGELANIGWRKGLKRQSQEMKPKADSLPVMPAPGSQHAVWPRDYPNALDYLRKLVADGVNPQWRGRELEKLVLDVLVAEKLSPESDLRNPGEQIDHAFVLDAQHYLVECKWEHDPIGFPVLAALTAKVSRKAVGTFGVLLSMSGFVPKINEQASTGAQLNCVGIVHQQFIGVLEGRNTLSDLVRNARTAASRRSIFHM